MVVKLPSYIHVLMAILPTVRAVESCLYQLFNSAMFVFCCLQDANVLYGKHHDVSRELQRKYNETRVARERAAELKERATEMYTSTKTKVDRLSGKGFTQVRWSK